MSILNKDEFFARVQGMVSDDHSDDAIAFVEDMTDTYTDMENKAAGDGVDWKAKYEENDASWRKKYRHRFFNGGGSGYPASEESAESSENREETITINDLFKKEK